MASIKISELNETTELESNDLFAVVDTVADETKKMSYGSLKTQLIGDNFAVLTGTVEQSELSLLGKSIPYPNGYNQNNCVVIGYMTKSSNSSFWTTSFASFNNNNLTNSLIVRTTENNIVLNNTTAYSSSTAYNYRIILMKIS